jgi:hypothetical protein
MSQNGAEIEVQTYDLEVDVDATQHPAMMLQLSPCSGLHMVYVPVELSQTLDVRVPSGPPWLLSLSLLLLLL